MAHALDLIGDRWTLLIVRDLLLGPKRFTDLVGGLPGIGTNLLTERLKGLEQAGIVQRRVLPPPAASTVYELSAYGQALEGPLVALAQWGGQSLGQSQPDQIISRDSVVLTARALIRALARQEGLTIYAIDVVDARFTERIVAQSQAGHGDLVQASATDPDLTMRMDVDTLFALVGGGLSVAEGVATGALQVHGAPAMLQQLIQPA